MRYEWAFFSLFFSLWLKWSEGFYECRNEGQTCGWFYARASILTVIKERKESFIFFGFMLIATKCFIRGREFAAADDK